MTLELYENAIEQYVIVFDLIMNLSTLTFGVANQPHLSANKKYPLAPQIIIPDTHP